MSTTPSWWHDGTKTCIYVDSVPWSELIPISTWWMALSSSICLPEAQFAPFCSHSAPSAALLLSLCPLSSAAGPTYLVCTYALGGWVGGWVGVHTHAKFSSCGQCLSISTRVDSICGYGSQALKRGCVRACAGQTFLTISHICLFLPPPHQTIHKLSGPLSWG